MRAPRPAVRHLAAASLLASLLAACGGSDGTPPVVPPTCATAPSVTLGATEAWRYVGATDWPAGCDVLTVRAPSLASGERLGLVLVNAGGADNATPSIVASGTLTFADAGLPPVAAVEPGPALVLAPSPRDLLEEGRALSVERRRARAAALAAEPEAQRLPLVQAAPAAALAVGDAWKDARGPCVFSFTTNTTTRQPATLRHLTAHAAFYVTDAKWADFQRVLTARPDLWTTLESYYEGTVSTALRPDGSQVNPTGAKRIYPALHEHFGVESDVDANGRIIFLFADLGRTGSGGFAVGYFDGTDVARPADATADCTGGGSNGADMLYLLDPCSFYKNGFNPPAATCPTSGDGTGGFPYSVVLDQEVPGTMAHELQHDVIYNTRCRASSLASCGLIDDSAGDLWMNEGLSMASEDFAGFGLNTAGERARVGTYLGCSRTGSNLCYQDVSLTIWPAYPAAGDPTGHYGGAHAFLRWLADQADAGRTASATGSALTKALVASPSGSKSAVAAAYGNGVAFEEVFARFGAGALFSGEDALFTTYAGPIRPSPSFAYATGTAWSPLHTTVSRVKYSKLQPGSALLTTLKADGWGAYLTGRGTGAEGMLAISSTAAVKPRAAVVRLKGDLALP